ncbi:MAG TPA: PQQ-binding-like beta-propeller repeat protein [Roseiflexaceae bacterium]|nr:PQQ-binding-like beta-propeller repeat protein [Roseiflexaceae bacterium]
MEAFKQRRGMILVVLAALGALAYVAWRPQAGPAVSRPTAAPVVVAPTKQPLPQPTPVPALQPLPQQPAAGSAPAPTAALVGAGLLGPQALNSTSGPDDWAMEGSNPSRTRSIDGALALPLTQRREVRLDDDQGIGSPLTIARGIMLVESQNRLRAIDLSSGAERWTFPLAGLYISPAVAGKYVFVRSEAGNKGQMLALDINTGQQLWAFTPQRLSSPDNSYFGGHLTSPVVVDGTVFVGAGQEVYALNATTGAVRWTFGAKDYISSSATVSNGQVYISDFRYLYALDQHSGAMVWSHPTTMSIYFSPVVSGQTVLLNDGAGLSALDAVSGKQLWTVKISSQTLIPGAVSGARVFVKSVSSLYALDLASGKQLWRFDDRNFISLPAVTSDQVFVVKGSGADTAIVALDAASGQSAWNQPVASLSTTAPVIAGKTIYVRTGDGRVLGFWH